MPAEKGDMIRLCGGQRCASSPGAGPLHGRRELSAFSGMSPAWTNAGQPFSGRFELSVILDFTVVQFAVTILQQNPPLP
jgi:hypothetical protein